MYFFLSNLLDKFQYIHYSLVAVLAFVGVKMVLVHHVPFPEWLSLAVIFVSLAAGALFSLSDKKTEVDIKEQKE
jgi:tellurite resistance protein TerC